MKSYMAYGRGGGVGSLCTGLDIGIESSVVDIGIHEAWADGVRPRDQGLVAEF